MPPTRQRAVRCASLSSAAHPTTKERRGSDQGRPLARVTPAFPGGPEPPDQSRGPPPASPSCRLRPAARPSRALSAQQRPRQHSAGGPHRPAGRLIPIDPTHFNGLRSVQITVHRHRPLPSPLGATNAQSSLLPGSDRSTPDKRATALPIRALVGFRTPHGPTIPPCAPRALNLRHLDHPPPPQPPPYTPRSEQQERLRACACSRWRRRCAASLAPCRGRWTTQRFWTCFLVHVQR